MGDRWWSPSGEERDRHGRVTPGWAPGGGGRRRGRDRMGASAAAPSAVSSHDGRPVASSLERKGVGKAG